MRILGFFMISLFVHSANVCAAEYTARLEWSHRVVLSTPVSGIVEKIAVQPGDRVHKGQFLLRLDQRSFSSEVRRATARVTKFALARNEAKREFERTQELFERQVISPHDLQLAEIAYFSAAAEHTEAEVELSQAKLALEYSELHAPLEAMVLDIPAKVGQTVVNTQQATPMVVLVSGAPMLARASTNEHELLALHPGQKVKINVAGKHFSGEIFSVVADPLPGVTDLPSFSFLVRFDPTNTSLRAGMTAKIVIP